MRRLLLATALAVCTGAAGCHKAPPPPDTSLDLLPYAQGLSDKELADRFTWLEFHPLGDRRLFFRIRVPRGWRARPSEISSEALRQQERQEHVTLAEVGPPDQDNVLIRVSYLREREGPGVGLSLEKPLQEYVNGLLSDQGTYNPQSGRSKWSILAHKEGGRVRGRQVLEALIEIRNVALGLLTARLQASRQGPLIFVVMGLAPSPEYNRLSQAFGVAVESFSLLDKAPVDKTD